MHTKRKKIVAVVIALFAIAAVAAVAIRYGILISKVRFPKEAELGAISNQTNEFRFIPPNGDTWEILLASRNPSVLTQELHGVLHVIRDGEPVRTIQFDQAVLQGANWLSRYGLSSRIITWKTNNKDLFRPGVPHKIVLTLDTAPDAGLSLWVSYHERWKPRL